ncbi:MAG TPA: Wzz/FepE/Etk N-terminal domain-containing protein [Candidatus Acidoferrales bacterium]|nr:Wzz/FepE/Etk N-terminal domain-containing protein [Candidatus Acidoferrales bacterium]
MPTRTEISDTAIKREEIAVDRYETRLVYPTTARRDASVARLELLWENRRFLLKVSAIGLVISLIIALIIPHRFNSTVQLMPPDQQSLALSALAAFTGRSGGATSALAPLAGLAGDLLGQRTSGQLFIGVLQSRTVLTALITKFDLRKVYRKKLWIDAGKTLVRRTDIKEDKKSGIITITVSDRSPQRAAEMAQEYVNQLNFVITELNTSSARREREFLEGRLKQVNAGLEVAERNFGDFASKNAAIDIPEEGKAMLEAGAELQGELIAAQTELQGLRQIYADDHVKVRSMQARVDELQRQIQNLGGKSASPGDVANADGDALYPTIRKLPVLGVQYADLLRTAKVQEAVFEVLTQEYELAKVQEAKEVPSVKVLDAPNIAERKSFPPRRVITIVGTLLFFVGAMLWIIGRDRWERLDPNDRRKSLALRVYGDMGEHWQRLVLRIRQARESRSFAAHSPDAQTPSGPS